VDKAVFSTLGMKGKPFFLVVLTFLIFIPFISHSNAQTYKVERVVDGDTLLLTNGEYVRLIGVDTPETKHPEKPVEYFGEEASRFTQGMVEGKEVRLEYDQTRSISEYPPDTKIIHYPQCPIA
jgi:endonuclease YncB( thermonuclease family)